jgi:hypothetical protein
VNSPPVGGVPSTYTVHRFPESTPLPPALRLFRGVVRRAVADWPVTLSAAILLLTAATVVAADALYADAVTLGGLRRSLQQSPPDDHNIVVSTRSPADALGERNAVVTEALTVALRSVGGMVVRQAQASWLEPVQGSAGAGEVSGLTSYEPLAEHAALVDGRWPEAGADPLEATLPADAADALGLAVGDRLPIADSRDPTTVVAIELTGTWQPNIGDPFWAWIEARGADDEGSAEPLVVTAADLRNMAVSAVAMHWWTMPAIDSLTIDAIETLRRDVAGLGGALQQAAPGAGLTVRTALPAIIVETSRSLLVTRAGILALGAQFAVLAIYAVVLVSSILVERRRGDAALMRARGGSAWHLGAMALGEAILIAIPVALIAPWLASTIVRTLATITRSGDRQLLDAAALGQTPVVLAVVGAVVGGAGLTIGAIIFNARAARAQTAVGRPQSRTLAQRLGIDLALVAIAIIGFWQLRVYGAPLTRNARGALGIDPLLVLTPAIGLLAGALLATRFLPRMAEVAEHALVRLRTAVAPLAARHVARRPLRYTRSALLLMLAVALATFAALYGGTWTQSQADQATYQAAGDVRVLVSRSPDLPARVLGAAYRAVPEVRAAAPVFRDTVRIGRAVRDAQLLALDPRALTGILSEIDPRVEDVFGPLADERPATGAVPIEGEPRRIAVTIDADLHWYYPDEDSLGDPLPGRGINVALLILDGDGRPQRIDAPADQTALFFGAGQQIDVPLVVDSAEGSLDLAYPVQLLGVEILVTSDVFAGGTMELVAVESSDGTSGNDWSAISLDPAAAEWHWQRVDFFGVHPYDPPGNAPGRIVLGGTEPGSFQIFSGTTFRLWPLNHLEQIAAVASTEFLAQSGTQVGDAITTSGAVPGVQVHIVGSVETFPTLDPTVPFLIVDDATLELSRIVATGQPTPASEWWLRVDAGAEASVLETLRSAPYSAAAVIGRQELTGELSSDPVALGVLGVLGLSSLAAMAFAGIAFLASATVSTSERVGEFAILRALGLSARQLATWLAAESAFLLAFGLLAGSAAGILLGWLVLPFASFTQDGTAAVPAPVVIIPWAAIAPLYGMTAVLFVASVLVVRRQLPSVRITDVLRGREEAA